MMNRKLSDHNIVVNRNDIIGTIQPQQQQQRRSNLNISTVTTSSSTRSLNDSFVSPNHCNITPISPSPSVSSSVVSLSSSSAAATTTNRSLSFKPLSSSSIMTTTTTSDSMIAMNRQSGDNNKTKDIDGERRDQVEITILNSSNDSTMDNLKNNDRNINDNNNNNNQNIDINIDNDDDEDDDYDNGYVDETTKIINRKSKLNPVIIDPYLTISRNNSANNNKQPTKYKQQQQQQQQQQSKQMNDYSSSPTTINNSNRIGRFTVHTFNQYNNSNNDDQSPYSTTTNCFDTITSLIQTSNADETEYDSDSQDMNDNGSTMNDHHHHHNGVGIIVANNNHHKNHRHNHLMNNNDDDANNSFNQNITIFNNNYIDNNNGDDEYYDEYDENMLTIHNDFNNRRLIIPHTEVLISRLRNEVVRPKNFNNEVRAGRDVKSFLSNPCVLLDLEGDSVEEIIDQMLMAIHNDLNGTLLSEARASLYDAKNAFQLSDFLQGIYHTENGEYLHDPTWLCTFASVNNLPARRIVIARLYRPSNFGPTLRHVQFIVLVLVPLKEKTSKSAFEIARTFASLFADSTLRISLSQCDTQAEFCRQISERVTYLKRRQSSKRFKSFSLDKFENNPDYLAKQQKQSFKFGKGLSDDFRRRFKYYISDFTDGIYGKNTLSKVSAAVLSIFFACILPPIAFGVVNEHNTHGLIGPKQGLIGQAIGGLIFALFSGQPLVIIATTAPLTLYVKIVYQASIDWNVNFLDLYAAVGCFCAFYLILYALLNVSNLMRYVTRSTEEIFATFVFVAFTAAALKECNESFKKHYCFEPSNYNYYNNYYYDNNNDMNMMNISINNSSISIGNDNITINNNITNNYNLTNDNFDDDYQDCLPAKSILFLFLMLGTVAMAVLLYNFSSTPYLNSILRNTLADYALPLSVISFSLIGSFLFRDVHTDSFVISADFEWRLASFTSLTPTTIGLAAFLGFFLSMLFFIAQSVCASIVGSPSNHLKKGSAFHWDLFVLGSLNAVLSMIGLPWIYGVLPHSPLHARLLADVVPATDTQHNSAKSYVVVQVRETRVTGVLVHLMIGAVVYLVPNSLSNIPVAVLCGLFLYCAISTLRNNSIHDRVVLVLTEQHSYPPTSYLRHVPQRTVHCFTATQLSLLALITFVGFCPWKSFRLFFPFMIALMIPIRRYILPLVFEEKHLKIIDSKHY